MSKGFSKSQVLDAILEKDCRGCDSFREYADTQEEPGEALCAECDFGEDEICDAIFYELDRRLWDSEIRNEYGYISPSAECQRIAEEERADYGVDWREHEYWWVFYDASTPIGFNTIKAVWEGAFYD